MTSVTLVFTYYAAEQSLYMKGRSMYQFLVPMLLFIVGRCADPSLRGVDTTAPLVPVTTETTESSPIAATTEPPAVAEPALALTLSEPIVAVTTEAPAAPEELLVNDAMFIGVPAEFKTSLRRLITVLQSPMVEIVMTFPLGAELRESEAGITAQGSLMFDVDTVCSLSKRISKSALAEIVQAISASPTLHAWRRATGFLAASLVNQMPEEDSVRDEGIALINKFVSFVKTFRLTNSGFVANQQLRAFMDVVNVVIDQAHVYAHLRADERCRSRCPSAEGTTPIPGEFAPLASSASSASTAEAIEALLFNDTHRPKSCAVCHAAREAVGPLKLDDFMAVISKELAQPKLSRKFNCNKFYQHVDQLVNVLVLLNRDLGDDRVNRFCADSGVHFLRFLSRCVSVSKFQSTIIATKFGKACGSSLPVFARIVLLPSFLVTSLTPIEYEIAPAGVGWGSDSDASDDEEEEYLDREIAVTAGDPLLRQSMDQLGAMTKFAFELPLMVSFTGSPAAGNGARKEWISGFFDAAFLTAANLFEYSDERAVFVRPAPLVAGDHEAQLSRLRQVGRMLGLSIQDKMSPAVSFTDGVLALILHKFLGEAQARRFLEAENPGFAATMAQLEKYASNDTAALPPLSDAELTFGELLAGGEYIAVTDTNVLSYVSLSAVNKVTESVRPQVDAIASGIYDVLPYGQLAFFTVDELGSLLRGAQEIDLAELKESTTYSPESTVNEHTIFVVWFWEIVSAFDEDRKQDLLRFVSGSSLAPIHGFKGPGGDRKWLQISLEDGLVLDQVPLAQTCFNQLRIPRYSSQEIMRERLLMAIQNTKTLENV